ncbi:MAG: class I SAM-dependent methyltransferase [Gemmatimonadales bacterium]|nr:MAG: class I SAM-dependent methyltransferase [Gemmatimonadales bacterium]
MKHIGSGGDGGPAVTPALLWVVLAGAASGLAWLGPTLATLPAAVVLYSLWTGALLLLVFRFHGGWMDRTAVILGGAVALRLLFLPTVPDLSVDPFRYLWDGVLSASGLNPYRFAPSDPELVHLHDTVLFREMNSRDFHSIYPPLSQWIFLLGGLSWERFGWPGAFLVMKTGMTVLELAGVTALLAAARIWGVRPGWVALYALNPLAVVTVAGGGHSEGGLVLGLGVLAWGLARGRGGHAVAAGITAWAGLGLAVISKGIPVVGVPLLLIHHLRGVGWRGTAVRAILGGVPALVLSLPFMASGLPRGALASADLYVSLFEFNAALLAPVRAALEVMPGGSALEAGRLLRWVFLALATMVILRHPLASGRQVMGAYLLLQGLYLVTATTVHPWYLLWALPLVPLVTAYRGAWLWASWAAFPTYLVYTGVPMAPLSLLFWGGIALLAFTAAWPWIRRRLLPLAGWRKARQIQSFIPDRGLVLDLGAGEGWVGSALAREEGRQVMAADVEPFLRCDLPYFVFDGRSLPLRDGAVDTVVLSLVLHHASDPDALLREALRVARGRVIITESTYRWEWERWALERVDRWVNRERSPDAQRWARAPLTFRRVDQWVQAVERGGGKVLLSRRLNRVGHRHHLLMVEPATRHGPRP